MITQERRSFTIQEFFRLTEVATWEQGKQGKCIDESIIDYLTPFLSKDIGLERKSCKIQDNIK